MQLSVEPQLASWDRAGHPSQLRLASFLAHVDAVAAPIIATEDGRLAVELIVGLPAGLPRPRRWRLRFPLAGAHGQV